MGISGIVNINGQLVSPHNAKISVFDRGFLYGDSVYETLRVYEGIPFALEQHLDRFFCSGERIYFTLPWGTATLKTQIKRTLSAAPFSNAYLRIVATRGSGKVGLDTDLAVDPVLLIFVLPLPYLPPTLYTDGRSARLVNVRRNHKEAIDPLAKTGNYINSVMAQREAKEYQADEAIMLDAKGRIAEASSANVFAKIDGEWRTPPLEVGILGGITRATILQSCAKNNITVKEMMITPQELRGASELFLSSSLREMVPVVLLDDKAIGKGKVGKSTQEIHQLYKQTVSTYLQASGAEAQGEEVEEKLLQHPITPQKSLAISTNPLIEAPKRNKAKQNHGTVRVGVFIDIANLAGAARRLYGVQQGAGASAQGEQISANIDFCKLLVQAIGAGQEQKEWSGREGMGEGRELVAAYAYAIEKRSSFSRFAKALKGMGYRVRSKKIKRFDDGTMKADWDVGIAVEMLTQCDRFDVVVLGSGDGDYKPVVIALKQAGVRVELICFKERTAAELIRCVDAVISLDSQVLQS